MTTKNICKCDSVTAITVSHFQILFLLIFWCHKCINIVKGYCVTLVTKVGDLWHYKMSQK